jgi:hypothetical protein
VCGEGPCFLGRGEFGPAALGLFCGFGRGGSEAVWRILFFFVGEAMGRGAKCAGDEKLGLGNCVLVSPFLAFLSVSLQVGSV